MKTAFSNQSLAKIAKHSVNVFPLEAYGFLIGTQDIIYAALPVGKTLKWHTAADRFADLESAFELAKSLANEYEMIVPAIYHSHASDRIKESPVSNVPLMFQHKIVYISNVSGSELLFKSYAFCKNSNGQWTECKFTKLTLQEINLKTNPRRIMSRWNKLWKVVDYGNNHETELKRLYTSESETKQITAC
jgi:hypothetical protein